MHTEYFGGVEHMFPCPMVACTELLGLFRTKSSGPSPVDLGWGIEARKVARISVCATIDNTTH